MKPMEVADKDEYWIDKSYEFLVFAPGDVAFGNSLYVLHRGVAIYGGKVLASGGVWGEDMLLTNPRLRLRFYARALNYVEAFSSERRERSNAHDERSRGVC